MLHTAACFNVEPELIEENLLFWVGGGKSVDMTRLEHERLEVLIWFVMPSKNHFEHGFIIVEPEFRGVKNKFG